MSKSFQGGDLKDAGGLCAALLPAFFSMFLFSPDTVLLLIIVLGQAHFAITYLYQKKAGKLTPTYMVLYASVAIVLFFFFARFVPTTYITITAGALFVWHFYLDELRIAALPVTTLRAIVGGFSALAYGGMLAISILPFSIPGLPLIFLGLMCVAGCLLLRKDDLCLVDVALFCIGAIAVVLLIGESKGFFHIPVEYSLGVIIIAHYIRWYIYFGFKLISNKTLFSRYIFQVAGIQIAVLALYGLYVSGIPPFRILSVLFTQTNFYLWTILHILFSYRQSDYGWVRKLNRV